MGLLETRIRSSLSAYLDGSTSLADVSAWMDRTNPNHDLSAIFERHRSPCRTFYARTQTDAPSAISW